MGVEGSGKTTVGQLLAQKLHWQFADADDFHPPANIGKIHRGIPLGDKDRAPWLSAIRAAIDNWDADRKNVILACSALKDKYRQELGADSVQFVYLKGNYELILSRLRARRGHFASNSILASQFADLEEPEDAISVSVDKTPEAIVSEIIAKLKLVEQAYPDPTNL